MRLISLPRKTLWIRDSILTRLEDACTHLCYVRVGYGEFEGMPQHCEGEEPDKYVRALTAKKPTHI